VLTAVSILLALAAVAADWIWYARLRHNEAAAVVSLRIIGAAEQLYFRTYDLGYSGNLRALGPPDSGLPSALAADLIPAALASGQSNGYRFNYAPGTLVTVSGGTAPVKKRVRPVVYSLTAVPLRPKLSGVRSYYIDESALIRFALSGPVGPLSPLISP
jgi:type IV pilus assembly protein PilA